MDMEIGHIGNMSSPAQCLEGIDGRVFFLAEVMNLDGLIIRRLLGALSFPINRQRIFIESI